MKRLLIAGIVLSAVLTARAQTTFPTAGELDLEKTVQVLLDTQNRQEELITAGKFDDAISLGTATLEWYDALPPEFNDDDDYPWGIYLYMVQASAEMGDHKLVEGYLVKALDHGCNNLYWLDYNDSLAEFRETDRYTELTAGLRERFDFIGHLKRDHDYRKNSEEEDLPLFTYAKKDFYRFEWINDYFRLDTIAAGDSEIERIIALMEWVHDNITYDGSRGVSCEPTAIDIYNYSKVNNQGVNCRMMATVLNEIYLASGFKSRFVTCLPKDKNDNDCHVITIVYSETLDKWVWMDPSFNAWVTDENGNLLGIEEVRTRLIDGLPLELNETANMNGQELSREFYLDYYMTKNLYWFECTANSVYNTESPLRADQVYIDLVPYGYQPNQYADEVVRTSDPEYFWQTP